MSFDPDADGVPRPDHSQEQGPFLVLSIWASTVNGPALASFCCPLMANVESIVQFDLAP